MEIFKIQFITAFKNMKYLRISYTKEMKDLHTENHKNMSDISKLKGYKGIL